ncbi:spore coat protein [Halobacillus shinanisalinarum]|uniref:Spore coat protein n=1 Tax=Halobacillus shinanisalinarum TaxID=2932258 RepID=A0ABY4H1R2_9BACI|nr:spore coat protein [Halobacillus shinanisalinarum]UOQ94377.1 spore coat protein [Halobacillus shinanisalinarum]
MNPYHSGYVEVPPLLYSMKNPSSADAFGHHSFSHDNKWIALESHAASKSMAETNFTSALMMRDTNVRYAHIEMALQQITLQEGFAEVIKQRGWSFSPHVGVADQINTYQHFQTLFHEYN